MVYPARDAFGVGGMICPTDRRPDAAAAKGAAAASLFFRIFGGTGATSIPVVPEPLSGRRRCPARPHAEPVRHLAAARHGCFAVVRCITEQVALGLPQWVHSAFHAAAFVLL